MYKTKRTEKLFRFAEKHRTADTERNLCKQWTFCLAFSLDGGDEWKRERETAIVCMCAAREQFNIISQHTFSTFHSIADSETILPFCVGCAHCSSTTTTACFHPFFADIDKTDKKHKNIMKQLVSATNRDAMQSTTPSQQTNQKRRYGKHADTATLQLRAQAHGERATKSMSSSQRMNYMDCFSRLCSRTGDKFRF